MGNPFLFSVGKFSELSNTTIRALHIYDRIGLLSPAARGKNGYRYYSSNQLSVVNVIHILQGMDMTLEEITELRSRRTPESINKFLVEQIGQVEERANNWIRSGKLLTALQKSISSALGVDEEDISIKYLASEAIILGELNNYNNGKNDYNALHSFYYTMRKKYPNLDLNYPVWGRFSGERIIKGNYSWPDYYYFYNPEGYDRRPSGFYAVGYARGGYGQTGELYERIKKYINENGFEICGDAYEEYPLNEFSVADENNYLIRVMITVREKSGGSAGDVNGQ